MRASAPVDLALAYQDYFTTLGREKLEDLLEDPNCGIALQAAWEVNYTVVKRDPPIHGRSEWVLDENSVAHFLDFADSRLKVPISKWWRSSVRGVDVFPGQHHTFELGYTKRNEYTLEEFGCDFAFSNTNVKIKTLEELRSSIREFNPHVTMVSDNSRAFIVLYGERAYLYSIFAIDLSSGKILWQSKVWACRTGFSGGPADFGHNVYMQLVDNIVVIFGVESSAYIEAFDVDSGEAKFRFCTSYWFNFAEEWDWSRE